MRRGCGEGCVGGRRPSRLIGRGKRLGQIGIFSRNLIAAALIDGADGAGARCRDGIAHARDQTRHAQKDPWDGDHQDPQEQDEQDDRAHLAPGAQAAKPRAYAAPGLCGRRIRGIFVILAALLGIALLIARLAISGLRVALLLITLLLLR